MYVFELLCIWSLLLKIVRFSTVSGEGLFVQQVTGQGTMWVTSLGAIFQRTLQPGEQWIGTWRRTTAPDVYVADRTSQSTTGTSSHGQRDTRLNALMPEACSRRPTRTKA